MPGVVGPPVDIKHAKQLSSKTGRCETTPPPYCDHLLGTISWGKWSLVHGCSSLPYLPCMVYFVCISLIFIVNVGKNIPVPWMLWAKHSLKKNSPKIRELAIVEMRTKKHVGEALDAWKQVKWKKEVFPLPIGSMYGIFTYIWLIFMDFYGKCR